MKTKLSYLITLLLLVFLTGCPAPRGPSAANHPTPRKDVTVGHVTIVKVYDAKDDRTYVFGLWQKDDVSRGSLVFINHRKGRHD